jgi:hypothetical protein
LLNGFSKRVVFDPKLFGDILSRATGVQQLLRLLSDFFVNDTGAPTTARCIEGQDTFFAVLFHTAQDAVFRDSEGTYDLHLSTGPLTDKLRREHLKCSTIVLGVREDGMGAMKVGPLIAISNDIDDVIDSSSTIGNEW